MISHAQAARIIGTHFGEVKDKLLNTLRLREQAGAHSGRRVDRGQHAQRSRELGPVPFCPGHRPAAQHALPALCPSPLLVLAVLLLAAPVRDQGTHAPPDGPRNGVRTRTPFFLVNDTLEVP